MALIFKLSIPYNLVRSPVIPHLRHMCRLWSSRAVVKNFGLEAPFPFSRVCEFWQWRIQASLSWPWGQHGRSPGQRLPSYIQNHSTYNKAKRVCGGGQRSLFPNYCSVVAVINHYRFRSLSQHKCIILQFCQSEVWHRFHWASIFFLETPEESLCSYVFQCLETSLIPWLVALFLHL